MDSPRRASFSLQFRLAGERFFSGLDISKSGRTEVHFTIARDAGKFECEGFVQTARARAVSISQLSRSIAEMKSLGFERIDGDKTMGNGIHDVSR